MRRLLQTKAGQVLSHIVAAALILPSVTFGLSRRAEAQLQQNPSVAVVDFRDAKNPGSEYGRRAAEALSGFFGTTQAYDVVPRDTIEREVTALELRQPLPNLTNVLRVGQQLRLTRAGDTIVSGEVVDYRVRSSAQGKQADVSLLVVMTDVPSQTAVNGAGVTASSTIRSGDVSDETLINDAISQAANQAVQTIRSQTLPTATIQNTFARSAIINQGARTGFKNGQDVIVSRGREQVATARVSDVQPSSATIVIQRSFKGLQPGDRVRAVFSPPKIVPGFNGTGTGNVARSRRGNNLSGLLTVVLVLGLVFLIAGGGEGSDTEAADKFEARPQVDPAGTVSVALNWSGNGFAKGNSQTFLWQIYRDDNLAVPALVVPGTERRATDGASTSRTFVYDNNLSIGGFNCPNPTFSAIPGTSTAPIAGRPYTYSIELVYVLQRTDTFAGAQTTGGNTGNTAGTTGTASTGTTSTAGGTTGVNNSGTNGTTNATTGSTGVIIGDDPCFFVSGRTSTRGTATALARPTLISPANNASLTSNSTPFSFTSSANGTNPVTLQYVLQISASPVFQRNQTFTYPPFIRSEAGTLATAAINTSDSSLPAVIRNAAILYYRIGVRNVADKPGPVPDAATKQRYIFSVGNRVTRPGTPPNPPG